MAEELGGYTFAHGRKAKAEEGEAMLALADQFESARNVQIDVRRAGGGLGSYPIDSTHENLNAKLVAKALRLAAAQGSGAFPLGSVSLEALDLLQLQQRGRAQAFRILDAHRDVSDPATLAKAEAYEECGFELKAILSLPAEGGAREAAIEECARSLETSYPGHAWLNAACAAIRSLAHSRPHSRTPEK